MAFARPELSRFCGFARASAPCWRFSWIRHLFNYPAHVSVRLETGSFVQIKSIPPELAFIIAVFSACLRATTCIVIY